MIKILLSKLFAKKLPETAEPRPIDQPIFYERAGYYFWQKGVNKPLSANFGTKEFTCQCSNSDCEWQMVSKELIEKLQRLRTNMDSGITITSGYRCEKHQAKLAMSGLQTAKNSQHVLGNAADISSSNLSRLHLLSKGHFKAIGVAKTFLHVDLRSDKYRTWTYT